MPRSVAKGTIQKTVGLSITYSLNFLDMRKNIKSYDGQIDYNLL